MAPQQFGGFLQLLRVARLLLLLIVLLVVGALLLLLLFLLFALPFLSFLRLLALHGVAEKFVFDFHKMRQRTFLRNGALFQERVFGETRRRVLRLHGGGEQTVERLRQACLDEFRFVFRFLCGRRCCAVFFRFFAVGFIGVHDHLAQFLLQFVFAAGDFQLKVRKSTLQLICLACTVLRRKRKRVPRQSEEPFGFDDQIRDGGPLLVAAVPAVGFDVVFVRFDRDEKDFAARRLMVRFAVVFDEKEAGKHVTVLQFHGGNIPQGVVVPCGLMRRSVLMFIEENGLPLDAVDRELQPEGVEAEIIRSGGVQPDAVVGMDFDVARRLPLFENGQEIRLDGDAEPRRHLPVAVVVRQDDSQIIRLL